MKPLLDLKLFCLPPCRHRQNPTHIRVRVWPTLASARKHFRSTGGNWHRDALAYFSGCNSPLKENLLGEVNFVAGHFSLPVAAHEFVHAAKAFADLHARRHFIHCPYQIGTDREECLSYVVGTLLDGLFKGMPATLRKRWLKNSYHPLP